MKPSFENLHPSACETSVFRCGRPCRCEEPSQPTTGHALLPECIYETECELTSPAILLDRAYRGLFKVSLTEYSACHTIRSEHQYNLNDRLRMSLRKHIYEVNSDEPSVVGVTQGMASAIVSHVQQCSDAATSPDLRAYLESRFGGRPASLESQEIENFAQHLAQLLQDDPRWPMTQRNQVKGIFQDWFAANTSVGDDGAEIWAEHVVRHLFAPMRCHTVLSTDHFGKYLGFVDLRLNSAMAPLALGLLVPPRHLRHDPDARFIVGEYSSLFGATGFTSTVYAMHEPQVGGARCAQACVMMVRAMLSDRGAKMYGSYEITYLAKCPQARPAPSALPPANEFQITGLNISETLAVLNLDNRECTAGAFFSDKICGGKTRDRDARSVIKLAERLIECYVQARLPMILFLDAPTLNPAYKRLDERPANHAVVVVGARRKPNAGVTIHTKDVPIVFSPHSLSDLIIHDPGLQPYAVWPTDALFYASSQHRGDPDSPDSPDNCLNVVFVGDGKIQVHASSCLHRMLNAANDIYDFHESTLIREYLTQQGKDLRVALVHRDDVQFLYFESTQQMFGQNDAELSATQKRIQGLFPLALQNGWYWAIAGYQDEKLRSLWLCSTRESGDCPWEWRFHVFDDGTHLGNDSSKHRWSEQKNWLSRKAWSRVGERSCGGNAPPSTMAGDGFKQPPPANVPKKQLSPSVITSSSDRSLETLLGEVTEIDGVCNFDLFVLRDRDIQEMAGSSMLKDPRTPAAPLTTGELGHFSSADLLACEENVSAVKEWLVGQFKKHPTARISAFATYYPQITNTTNRRPSFWGLRGKTFRETAIDALANTICLGLDLKEESGQVLAEDVIVEAVCGTKLEQVETVPDDAVAAFNESERVRVVADTQKIRVLVKSLLQVITRVYQRRPTLASKHKWAISLELEPGVTYCLGNDAQLRSLISLLNDEEEAEQIARDTTITSIRNYKKATTLLHRHVGLNVDIAHWRMAGLSHSQVKEFADRIVHAHITDHPGMHTRDQALGSWMVVDRYDAPEYKFLSHLAIAGARQRASGLPFSGFVALELEGCGRIRWIHSSLNALRQMCATVDHHCSEVLTRP